MKNIKGLYLLQAGKFALERGWAINIGGGFHHCSAEKGGGFCAYADITLTIKFLFNKVPDRVKKAMIIDLDAHQVTANLNKFLNLMQNVQIFAAISNGLFGCIIAYMYDSIKSQT